MQAKLFLLFIAICGLLFTPKAQAQTPTCQPIFGGGQSCISEGSITLDKKLRSPNSSTFVDSTKLTDPKFSPDQQVTFQLTIKNTGNRAIEDVTVNDIFPRYVTFMKGPGQFNRDTNTLTFSIDKLEAGQSRVITIEGKIVSASAIPGTNTVSCVVNQAIATQGRNRASDNAEFCLQKGGQASSPNQIQPQPSPTPKSALPVYEAPKTTTAPKTGPEALALFSLLPLGATGFYLRRHFT